MCLLKESEKDNDCRWVKPSADAGAMQNSGPSLWGGGPRYHKQNSSLCHQGGCWSFSIIQYTVIQYYSFFISMFTLF